MKGENIDLNELLSRSISYIFPSKDALKKHLKERKKLKIYLGVDATGPELHIGHATNLIFLEKLRRLGHEVILLFGDFTALIGDPTGKSRARIRLTKSEIERNIKNWKSQAGKVLDFTDAKNPAKVLRNSKWLAGLNLRDVIELASNMTVQQMIERDMFQKRTEDRKPIYLHEFLYPLMQGYDSVAMNVTAEIGGTDQIFNMFVGRELQKKYNNKDKFIIATALLEDPNTGKKLMNKSEGTYISLTDEPKDMYGKAMALPDETIIQVFTHCTFAPMEEIEIYEGALVGGENPKDIKMKLAWELVKTYHNEDAADSAEQKFVATFQEKKKPSDIRVIKANKGDFLGKVLVKNGVVDSNTEFKRLVNARAVRNMDTGEKIDDHTFLIEENATFKIGKKKFVRVVVR